MKGYSYNKAILHSTMIFLRKTIISSEITWNLIKITFYKDTSKWRLWRGGVKNFLDLGEKSFKKTAKAWKTGLSQLGYSHLVLWPLRSVEEMLPVRAVANFFAHFWTFWKIGFFLKNWILGWKGPWGKIAVKSLW